MGTRDRLVVRTTDYINFQIPNMNPGGIPVGVGVVSPPLTWRTKRWQ